MKLYQLTYNIGSDRRQVAYVGADCIDQALVDLREYLDRVAKDVGYDAETRETYIGSFELTAAKLVSNKLVVETER